MRLKGLKRRLSHRLLVSDRRARVEVSTAVNAAFPETLGRGADPDGLAYFSSQIRAGRAIKDLVLEFTMSREGVVHAARHRYGLLVDDRTDEEFITELYREVLDREADASGRTWLGGLLRAGTSRKRPR